MNGRQRGLAATFERDADTGRLDRKDRRRRLIPGDRLFPPGPERRRRPVRVVSIHLDLPGRGKADPGRASDLHAGGDRTARGVQTRVAHGSLADARGDADAIDERLCRRVGDGRGSWQRAGADNEAEGHEEDAKTDHALMVRTRGWAFHVGAPSRASPAWSSLEAAYDRYESR